MEQGLKKNIKEKTFKYTQGSAFEVPGEVLDYCEKNSLHYKWVRLDKISKGYIDNYWQPLNLDNAKITTSGFGVGRRSDGLLIRDDLFLAVRPAEVGMAHRQTIAQRRDAQMRKASNESVGAELKQMAKAGGMKTKIYDKED